MHFNTASSGVKHNLQHQHCHLQAERSKHISEKNNMGKMLMLFKGVFVQLNHLSKLKQLPPTQRPMYDPLVCRAQGSSLTPATITYHRGECKWVGFGMRQRGAGNCHGNRRTDSVATVWVRIVSVGRGMADPSRRGVFKEIREAFSGMLHC